MQSRRARRKAMRRRRTVTAALVFLLMVLAGIIACRADADCEMPLPMPLKAQESVTKTSRPVLPPKPVIAPTVISEPVERLWKPSETDVRYIAQTIYGEAGVVKSRMRRAAVAWCILNRVDAAGFPDTIGEVVTAKYQFSGYDPGHPVTDDLEDLAIDVLRRWRSEKQGATNVGRVLPSDYVFFIGDGRQNYFTNEWQGEDYWDWSLPNPYGS